MASNTKETEDKETEDKETESPDQELNSLSRSHMPLRPLPTDLAERLRSQVLAEIANTLKLAQVGENEPTTQPSARRTLKQDDRSWHKEKTIIGMLVAKKERSNVEIYLILLGAMVVHLLLAVFLLGAMGIHLLPAVFPILEINSYLILFLLALISLLYLNQYVTRYRISREFYGTNEYEAREIIQFILDHPNKTDFTDGSGGKKLIFGPEEIGKEADLADIQGVNP